MVVVGGYKAYRRGLAKAKTAAQRTAVIKGYSTWRATRAKTIAAGGAVTPEGKIISPQQVSASQTKLSQTLANLKRLELAKRDIESGKSIAEAYAGRRTVAGWLQTAEGKRALAEATGQAKIQYELIAQRETAAKAEIARVEAEAKSKAAEERAEEKRLITMGLAEAKRLGIPEKERLAKAWEWYKEKVTLPITVIKEKVVPTVRRVGERVIIGLAKASDWIERKRLKYLEPGEYKTQTELNEASVSLSNAVNLATKKSEKINEDVEAFVKKYPSDVELTQEEVKVAEDEAYRLRERIRRWETNEVLLKQNIRDYKLKEKEAELKFGLKFKLVGLPEKVLYASGYASYYLTAIPRAGLGYAALGVGLITRPVETVKEVVAGIQEFPSEFMKKPLRTMMDIAGAVTFWYLAEAGISALARGEIKFFKGKRARVGKKGKSKTVQVVVKKVKDAKKKKVKVKLTTAEAEEMARTIIHRIEKKWMVGGKPAAEAEVRRLLKLAKTVQERKGFNFLLKHLEEKNIIRSSIFNPETGQLFFGEIPPSVVPRFPRFKPPIVKPKPPIVKVKPKVKVKVKPPVVRPVTDFGLASREATAALLARQRAALKERQKELQALYGVTMPRVKLKAVPKEAFAPAQVFAQAMTGRVAIAPPVPTPLVPPTPVPVPAPPAPPEIPPFYIPRKPTKKEIEEEEKRKIAEAKMRAQIRAYQASVGAVAAGIYITPKEAARLRKFTGLELRPVIRRRPVRKAVARKPKPLKPSIKPSPYLKQLREQQGFLLGPAFGLPKKGSPTKAVKMLRAQQQALVAPAWGGRAEHRKKLKKQEKEIMERMKMYAKKIKPVRKKIPKKIKPVRKKIPKKKKTRKEKIIQNLNKIFS